MTGRSSDGGAGGGSVVEVADVAVWFDLDGTLLHLDRPYEAVLREGFGRHLDDADVERAVETYDFLDRFAAFEADPYRAVMSAVAESVGVDVDPSALVEALREAEYAAMRPPAGTRETLSAIDAPICVLTNGLPAWQRDKLVYHDIASPFDAVVASYEAGAHKPAPDPFALARERLAADRHVMVGDDREADVEGARAVGFEAVHAPNGIAAVREELLALL